MRAKATVWRVEYSHKHDTGRASHAGLFLTGDPSGAGIFEVVRDSIAAECRTDLVLGEVRRFGEADGIVLPATTSTEVN